MARKHRPGIVGGLPIPFKLRQQREDIGGDTAVLPRLPAELGQGDRPFGLPVSEFPLRLGKRGLRRLVAAAQFAQARLQRDAPLNDTECDAKPVIRLGQQASERGRRGKQRRERVAQSHGPLRVAVFEPCQRLHVAIDGTAAFDHSLAGSQESAHLLKPGGNAKGQRRADLDPRLFGFRCCCIGGLEVLACFSKHRLRVSQRPACLAGTCDEIGFQNAPIGYVIRRLHGVFVGKR